MKAGGGIFIVRLGVCLGILVSVSMFILSFLGDTDYAPILFKMVTQIYPGCGNKSFLNRLVCATLGFIDGFVGGCLIALLYNHVDIRY
jgi:hypothetical protein